MTKFQTSVLINRPMNEVFALLANPENNPKWQSGTYNVKKTSKGPIGLQTTWHSTGQLLGRPLENESEYTEYVSGHGFTSRTKTGPFQFESRVTLELVVGMTQVSVAAEGDTRGFFNLGDAIVVVMGKRQFQDDLANLKNLMETHAL